MRVVGLVRMRQDAIDQRGIDRPRCEIGSRDRRRTFPAARPYIAKRRLSGLQFRSGDHGGQRVEGVMLRVLYDLRGERAARSPTHIRAEHAHRRAWIGSLGRDALPWERKARHRRGDNAERATSIHVVP